MTFQPDPTKTQPTCNDVLARSSEDSGWLNRQVRRLKIGSKISLGYALSFGIAAAGISAGLLLGEYYSQIAYNREKQTDEQVRLFTRLQTAVLESRRHQQRLIPQAEQPQKLQQEYSQFLTHAAEVKQLWAQVQSLGQKRSFLTEVDAEALPVFLRNYEGVPQAYFQELDKLIGQINAPSLKPTESLAAQKRLLQFTTSPVALQFDGISDALTDIIEVGRELEKQRDAALMAAQSVKNGIVAAGILLSGGVAFLLASYTRRAIVRPLEDAIGVAQQVTRESNFYLQVPVTSSDEVGVLATSLNQLIVRVRQLLAELEAEKEAQLFQSEKMASLGRTLADVAHELNNPINFIYGNLDPAKDYILDILALLETYEAEISNPPAPVREHSDEIDLDFVKEDLPKLVHSMKVGAERARDIILTLKNFSRLDDSAPHPVDLHECIESSLMILNNRLKKDIKLVRKYGEIPAVEGYMGLLYQVFMNILSNAIDALEEKPASQDGKQIAISTELDSDWVVVRIADNGAGIAPDKQDNIFNTFFTTKPRGVGTGLGLSISRQIVEKKHGGRITFRSSPGAGTEFAIGLPVKQPTGTDSSLKG
ncbi:MAG: HAMP domain-containing histidine kinase [Oscillatoria princeps RMCB-10]|jgi:signal transduction histidine kinase|nr:HAMP domain-containing histidine kinase [Oscillatoria princeps RMCB-10]